MPTFIIIPLPISFTELLIIALVVLVINIIRRAAKGNNNSNNRIRIRTNSSRMKRR